MPDSSRRVQRRPRHDSAPAELCSRDTRLAAIIAEVGPYRPAPPRDHFGALVRAIVSQQVSKHAAEAILGRLHALFPSGRPAAAALRELPARKLIKAGLSRRKVEYLRELSTHVADGRLDFARLRRLPDEAVIERLTAVKGIGRWTAEIYLIFTLGRPDVLPLGDVALLAKVRELYELPADSGAEHFDAIAESWRPWRSIACWYLYRSINMRREARAAAQAAVEAAA